MKILMVNNFSPFGALGGAEQLIRDMTSELIKVGHEVAQLYTSPSDGEYKSLEGALTKFKPDVVHCHNMDTRLADLAALAFKRIPTVVTLHDYKSICYATLRLFVGKQCKQCDNKCGKATESKEKFAPLWDSHIIKVVGSRRAAEIFSTELETRVVHPAILVAADNPSFKNREGALFTAAHHHYWWKGNQIFKRVTAEMPVIELYSVSRAKVLYEMSKAAVYVHPGVYAETFGYSAAEASGMGCPVVCFDNGGLNDIVIDDQTGFLIEPFNEAAMQTRIKQLLEDKTLAEKFGHNGNLLVKHKFTAENMVNGYLNAYKDAIK